MLNLLRKSHSNRQERMQHIYNSIGREIVLRCQYKRVRNGHVPNKYHILKKKYVQLTHNGVDSLFCFSLVAISHSVTKDICVPKT
jgi:hypothetical protein